MTEKSMLHPDTCLTSDVQVAAGSSERPLSITLGASVHWDDGRERAMAKRSMPVHEMIVSGIIHLAVLAALVLSGGTVTSLVVRPSSTVTVYLTEGSRQQKSPAPAARASRYHVTSLMNPAADSARREEPDQAPAKTRTEIPAPPEISQPEAMKKESGSVASQEATSAREGKPADSGEAAQEEEGMPSQVEFGAPDGPRFLKRVEPVYPPMARRLGKEGRVLLGLFIDKTGRLVSVEVLEKADYGFERAAVDAIKESTFLPAVRGGRSVSSRSRLAVKFVLYNE